MTGLRSVSGRPAVLAWVAAAVVVLAGLVGAELLQRPSPASHRDGRAPASSDPARTTVVGYQALAVEKVTYAPAGSRAWGQDVGTHAVAVVAGTLTVEGPGRTHVSYGPGRSYVAGWAPYRAVNEGSEPVEVSITHLARPGR